MTDKAREMQCGGAAQCRAIQRLVGGDELWLNLGQVRALTDLRGAETAVSSRCSCSRSCLSSSAHSREIACDDGRATDRQQMKEQSSLLWPKWLALAEWETCVCRA